MLEIITCLFIHSTTCDILKMDKQRAYERSAAIRAICIGDGNCEFNHDNLRDHVDNEIIEYRYVGENLAKGYKDWDEVKEAWEKSPKHKEILDRKYCYKAFMQYKDVFVFHGGC